MIVIKSDQEIALMRQGGKILGKVLLELKTEVRAGVTTWELECKAKELLKKYQVEPAFLNYQNYPCALCISVNEEVVHGVPCKTKVIQEGDLVSLDLGVKYRDLITDAALTLGVGKITSEYQKLIETTKNALNVAVKTVKPGKKVSDISLAIQTAVEKNGFNVIRDCVGHGVGRKVHEDPLIPNFFSPLDDQVLKAGMTLAIEPIATTGDFATKTGTTDCNWVVITADQSPTAHFEKTIAVTKEGCEILTPF